MFYLFIDLGFKAKHSLNGITHRAMYYLYMIHFVLINNPIFSV